MNQDEIDEYYKRQAEMMRPMTPPSWETKENIHIPPPKRKQSLFKRALVFLRIFKWSQNSQSIMIQNSDKNSINMQASGDININKKGLND